MDIESHKIINKTIEERNLSFFLPLIEAQRDREFPAISHFY